MKNTGIKIRRIREIKNMSRAQMAACLNMTERGYGKIENGECSITLLKLEEVAQVFKMGVIELLQFDEENVLKAKRNVADLEVLLKSKDTIIKGLQEQLALKDELIDALRR